ncbi:uncharacterized protein LOC135671854 isoform X2 [Musa acuminata AAA Group]|uniref:uncharacterized protein LOC135671854 isoform X2 n=1 Tax=Musa acuminata AAA Group TaxID=214697 RepID=UPI0031DA9996
MDPGEGRELPSAGDEETIARKKSRRVSFADITAIHVFDRDDDYETPPDSRQVSADGGADVEAVGFHEGVPDSDGSKGSLRGREDEDDDENEEDDEDDGDQERFVRDMDSSSPGSAVGSVTSYDDDNFFGPVSTSFIGSGRLSEAGMSDDTNHDVTLDSTAFSLHFRNIALADDCTADSMRSMRTPTGDATTADAASIIVPTGSKNPFLGSKLFAGNLSGSVGGSSNMSLIEEKSSKYDYGKLSSTLVNLLDQVNRSIQTRSPKSANKVIASDSHLSKVSGAKESGENETRIRKAAGLNATGDCPLDSHLLEGSAKDTTTEQIVNSNAPEENIHLDHSISKTAEGRVTTFGKDSHKDANEVTQSGIDVTSRNINLLVPLHKGSRSKSTMQSDHVHRALHKNQQSGNNYPSSVSSQSTARIPASAIASSREHSLEAEGGMHTPKSSLQPFQALLQGSVSSLRAKRQQLFLSPVKEQPPSSLESELTRHGERISAIKNHISKFRTLEAPDLDNFQLGVSRKGHVPLDLEGMFKKEADISVVKCSSDPVINMEDSLLNSVQKTRAKAHNVDAKHLGFAGLDDARESTPRKADDAVTLSDLSFHLSGSETNMLQSSLISNDLAKKASDPDAHDVSQREKIKFKESCQPLNTSSEVDHLDHSFVQDSLPADGDLVGKKRRIEQSLVMDESHISKISRTEKSPIFSSEPVATKPMIHLAHPSEIIDQSLETGGQRTAVHWSDIFSKVSDAKKLVFSPIIHKLALQELDILEDMLGELQVARKYLKISSSLRNNDHLDDLHRQRVTEAWFLQDKFLYEQAKMQIKRAKLDQLRGKAHSIQSGLKECNSLKSMFSQLCLQNTRCVQNKENQVHSVSSITSCRNKEADERMASMRQELKMLEQKEDHLLKSLGVCCKIKGNMSTDGITKVANERLEMRNRINIIHQQSRLWELSNTVKRDNKHDIVLNYCNFLFQRFTIDSCQVSSILVNNSLHAENIGKTFHNMNAHVVFEFVFGDKGDSRVISSKCFQQKTLETSLLMGILLDVLEEVQVARMENLNLTFSTFSHTPRQLELQLCFMNFKNGQKVTLSMDMSELKCATYPSEPSELKYKICQAQTTLSPSLSARLMATLRSHQGKRLVILSLCRAISLLFQDLLAS